MRSKTQMCLTATVLSAALLGVAGAQQDSFPREREQAKSCAQVDWNKEMTSNHPRLIDACREVVTVNGENWARFEAQFVRVDPNDSVSFSIRDDRDRAGAEVTLDPAPGQVAYIDGRPTPFSELRRDQRVNLYVPEGAYGFTTQPGAPREQVAKVSPTRDARDTTRVATAERRSSSLPATAGPLPWFALGGLLTLLGAVGVRVGRKS